jgi:recombinational DNA repair protein RecT
MSEVSTTNQTGIAKFEPKSIRSEVVKQMEAMQADKFIKLPENYKESAFFAIEKLTTLDGIQNVPAIGVTKALISMFSNKLDYQKNHCYFFVQNDKNSSTGKSLRFGWQYQGLISVAKQTCDVYDVTPVLVYEDDVFETHYEYGALIIDTHMPTFEGEIRGGYCVIDFADKRRIVKYYTRKELDKRRGVSQASNGKFWNWEREMYEKTLVNAALKRLIETSSEVEAEGLYNEPEPTGRQVEDAEIIQQNEPQQAINQGEPLNAPRKITI